MAVSSSVQPSRATEYATDQSDSVAQVWSYLSGGKFRVRLDKPKARLGMRRGVVLDNAGNVIGDASDYIYGGTGFCVHTKPFGGYVPNDQIDFV